MSKKIVLIDDEEDFLELMTTMLEFHNYDVTAYSQADQFVAKLDEETYDLVVTDLLMPVMTGFEVLENIRAKESYKKIPAIVLTAKRLNGDEQKLIKKYGGQVLEKPFEPQALVSKIQSLLM
ncbi:MAG: response regulator [bacterium]|nr:response regulator [bacterium]MBU1918087.1 response regulator [bacterium]